MFVSVSCCVLFAFVIGCCWVVSVGVCRLALLRFLGCSLCVVVCRGVLLFGVVCGCVGVCCCCCLSYAVCHCCVLFALLLLFGVVDWCCCLS